MPKIRWTLEVIKEGIDRFHVEQQRPPTAQDFDDVSYLPSARQIQRSFGGMSKLRAALGQTELDYTRGGLRSEIASNAGRRGVEAEEALEIILIDYFGEPFVHTQKRYIRGGKSRYDFYVYAYNYSFGIDVFTTGRQEYIDKNIRHKIPKYAATSTHIPIYFVLAGDTFNDLDLGAIGDTLLAPYPNLHLMTMQAFLLYIQSLHPLTLPKGTKSIGIDEIEQI